MNIVERAYQIAREGDCAYVSDIALRLSKEGYDQAFQHLAAPMLKRQLKLMLIRCVPSG
jgi:hypothetical protein